jgi:hypothetical protein
MDKMMISVLYLPLHDGEEERERGEPGVAMEDELMMFSWTSCTF